MEYGIMNYPSLRFIPLEFDFDRKKPVMHAFPPFDRTIEALEEFSLHDGYQSFPFVELPNEEKLSEQLE